MTTAVHPASAQDIPAFHGASTSDSPAPASPTLTSTTFPSLTPDPARSVPTTLFYNDALASNPAERKWFININNQKDTNISIVPTSSTIYDLRGQESATHIDVTGFQAITAPSAVPASVLLDGSDEDVKRAYYPEVERLLLQQTGASRVVFFDHTVRRKYPEHVPETPQTRKPVQRVHVDQTPASAHVRVARHVQPPQPFRRVQLINVWRPIGYAVYDFPLAVCDFRTVDVQHDLVPTTLVYPRPLPDGETYSVRFNPQQRWYYWSRMTPDDVLFLKCYDSASRELTRVTQSGADVDMEQLRDVAGLTPHTAFKDEEGAKLGPQRQSIEVRALVFYD